MSALAVASFDLEICSGARAPALAKWSTRQFDSATLFDFDGKGPLQLGVTSKLSPVATNQLADAGERRLKSIPLSAPESALPFAMLNPTFRCNL